MYAAAACVLVNDPDSAGILTEIEGCMVACGMALVFAIDKRCDCGAFCERR